MYLEFGQRVLRRNESEKIGIVEIDGGAVEIGLALAGHAAANLEVAPGEEVLAGGSALRAVLRDDAGREGHQSEGIAPIQR